MSWATAIAAAVLRAPILVYRYALSPLLPSACRHLPSCSEYTEEAIRRNGAWKGGWLGLSRLCRCHPLGSHGFDPVPDLTHVHHPWYAPWRYGRWTGRHIRPAVSLDDAPRPSDEREPGSRRSS
jgi:putative membrane protein insertion efficiency factor